MDTFCPTELADESCGRCLTCCKTSALDTAAHSSSMNALPLISDKMETIGPEHPGLGLNEQTLQFSSHAHRRPQRKGFLSSVGRV